jgi:hypothetical protein
LLPLAVPAGTRLILLTDGEETCGGDPTAVVAELCRKGYVLDVVGIALEAQAQGASLRALAETCGGKFVVATEPAKLSWDPHRDRRACAHDALNASRSTKWTLKIVALLLEAPSLITACDPMWDVILRFLSGQPAGKDPRGY